MTMLDGVLYAGVALVCFIVFGAIILSAYHFIAKKIERAIERAKDRRQFEKEMAERNQKRKAERANWNLAVDYACRHLANAKDWRDPAGKVEFIRELFGEGVPQYLYYEFDGLTAEETGEVWQLCWGGRPNFGDLESHRNLRIRNAKVFLPEIRLSTGKVLALDQVGYADWFDDGEGFAKGVVVFSRLSCYGESTTIEETTIA